MIDHWLPRNKSSKKHSIFHGHFHSEPKTFPSSISCWAQKEMCERIECFLLGRDLFSGLEGRAVMAECISERPGWRIIIFSFENRLKSPITGNPPEVDDSKKNRVPSEGILRAILWEKMFSSSGVPTNHIICWWEPWGWQLIIDSYFFLQVGCQWIINCHSPSATPWRVPTTHLFTFLLGLRAPTAQDWGVSVLTSGSRGTSPIIGCGTRKEEM